MLLKPANSNTRAVEAHSHDEVGFAREWSRAEQDEYARRRVLAMEEASRDPGLRKDIEELKARCRAAVIVPRKLDDANFDQGVEDLNINGR